MIPFPGWPKMTGLPIRNARCDVELREIQAEVSKAHANPFDASVLKHIFQVP
jgi:hypothetical protein